MAVTRAHSLRASERLHVYNRARAGALEGEDPREMVLYCQSVSGQGLLQGALIPQHFWAVLTQNTPAAREPLMHKFADICS